jgi:protein-tyrosine phosphatase
MDEIRPWLYIGKYRDTLDKSNLEHKSIQAMLQFAEPVEQPGIVSLYLRVEDMDPTPHHLIKQGVEFILAEKEKGHKILVACGAGINRSTAFCIAALKEVEGISLINAYKDVKIKHFDAFPNASVWISFCEYYNEATPYLDVMRLSIQNF